MTMCLRSLLFGALLSLASTNVWAEVATIHLQDGSKLRGEVVSLKGGAYAIRTNSAGTLSIPQDEVKLVEYGNAQTANPTGNGSADALDPGLMQSMQARLLQDPGLMKMIEALRSDAQVQAIMNDPEIQAAIASGDFLSLLNNPRFKALMQNPQVKKITEAAQGSQ